MVVLCFTEHDILGAGEHCGPVLEGGGGRKAGHRLPAPGTDHRTTRCPGECLDCLVSKSENFGEVDNILTGINYELYSEHKIIKMKLQLCIDAL